MADPIHCKTFRVRTVDIDLKGRIQPVAFLDSLLESAGEHAASLGVGVTDLMGQGLTWVLSRLHAVFVRYPQHGEEFEIRTWPSGRQTLFALRDFEVRDGKGIAARATSSWLVIDLKGKRPVRPADRLPPYPLHASRVIEDGFRPLPAPTNPDATQEFPVFYSDIDLNQHVTATVYIHRALESVPEAVLRECRPAAIEVNYRAEAFYGDSMLSRVERLEGGRPTCFLHRLSRASDDLELAVLRTTWDVMD
jgi:medium-chain acyl-[acyl-carrier-protein] hydrolase